MTDPIASHVADWLASSGQDDNRAPEQVWACVEIFGHRKHYGRIIEVEKFGQKFLRVDVPAQAAAPLLGEPERFETFVYGGAAIFSVTPMTEEAARSWADRYRPRLASEYARLPSPASVDGDDDG